MPVLWKETQQTLKKAKDDVEGPVVTVESYFIFFLIFLESRVGQFEGDDSGECKVDEAV